MMALMTNTTDTLIRSANVGANDLKIGMQVRYVAMDFTVRTGVVESVKHDDEGTSLVCLRYDGETYCTDFLRYLKHFQVVG